MFILFLKYSAIKFFLWQFDDLNSQHKKHMVLKFANCNETSNASKTLTFIAITNFQ